MELKHQILAVQTTAILAFCASITLIPLCGIIACMKGLCVTLLLAALWYQMDKRYKITTEWIVTCERANHWYTPEDKLPLYDGTYLCAFTQSYPTQFQVCAFDPETKLFYYFDRTFEPDYWCYLPYSYICKVGGGKKGK